jgi:hypothetical protein
VDSLFQQFRNSELSLWQSAVDQIVAKQEGAPLTLGTDGEAEAVTP